LGKTVIFWTEIFSNSKPIYVKYHPGAIVFLCLAELYYTLTARRSIPQLRSSTRGTVEYILIYVVNKTSKNVCCFADWNIPQPLSTGCGLRNLR
jgi:hypothetical protein